MRNRMGWMALAVAAFAGSVWLNAQAPPPPPAPPTAADLAVLGAIRANDMTRLRTLVTTPASANAKTPDSYTRLMDAVSMGSIEAVTYLLDKGADVNAQTESGISALMLADGDLARQRLLLDRGAKVNAATKFGRTAVFLAAMRDPSADTVRFLVSRGADLKVKDQAGNTLLTAAAVGNDTDTIRQMLDAGIDVNAAAVTGVTALMWSAGQRNVDAVKLLLAKHADVNAVAKDMGMTEGRDPKSGPLSLHAYTPLLFAVTQGPAELVATLLDAGANVNAVESRKLTPLMIAVAADHQKPDVIRLLLARGADTSLKGTQVGTAADWATRIGAPDALALLHAPAPAIVAPARTSTPLDPKTAVERGVALLETSSKGFFEKSSCVACHAQNMTDMAVAEARSNGASFSAPAAAERSAMYDIGAIPAVALHERGDIQVPEIVAYSAAGMAAAGRPADRQTDAMALNLAATQSRDGAWHQMLGIQQRPGAEDGDFTRTAVSLHALVVYGPAGRKADMTARIAKGREWLARATPVTAEDRSMQLLGLAWSGADAATMKPFVAGILSTQQADGGWRQREGLGTDAYATGEALYALAKGGVSRFDAHYKSGVQYLLTTQRASDGSWRVESRAPKFQAFFQSGFPYAGDQWISQWATGWASMALAQAIDAPARAQ